MCVAQLQTGAYFAYPLPSVPPLGLLVVFLCVAARVHALIRSCECECANAPINCLLCVCVCAWDVYVCLCVGYVCACVRVCVCVRGICACFLSWGPCRPSQSLWSCEVVPILDLVPQSRPSHVAEWIKDVLRSMRQGHAPVVTILAYHNTCCFSLSLFLSLSLSLPTPLPPHLTVLLCVR